MHPLSVDVGVPWTNHFFKDKEGWRSPENIVASIDQFLAATIAYGHIGWLVEEAHGIRQTCRSYYMLQPLQSRYAMLKPLEILYGTDHGLVSSSKAFTSGDWRKSKIFIHYPNDLRVWVNGYAEESWVIEHNDAVHNLPPFGWLAVGAHGFHECSGSIDGRRYDRASSPECIFVDGRGQWRSFDGVAASGSVAVRRANNGRGLSIITVEGVDRLEIAQPSGTFDSDDVRTAIGAVACAEEIAVKAFDLIGKELGDTTIRRIAYGWELSPPPSTLRMEIAVK
jgi:hypothetical protein